MPIHNKLALSMLALALAGSGCVAHANATSSFEATAEADASGPELVLVSPDIWVVEDYDQAVFFYADAYWTSRGGVWYRSEVHTGGWVQVTVVPTVIVYITRPEVYVHYHGPKHAKRRGHKHKYDDRVYARPAPAPHRDESQGHDRPGREERYDKHEKKEHDYKGRGKKHGDEKKDHAGHAYRGHGPKGKDKKEHDGRGRNDHKNGGKKSKGPGEQH